MTERSGSTCLRASALLLLAATPAAQAEDTSLIQQRGYVSLGAFLNNSEMKIRADAQGDQGTVVDWSNTFGDKVVTRFRLDGLWRITPRHHVRMMFTDYGRDDSETIDRDIEWRGETIPASATVRSRLGFTIVQAGYEYAFLIGENYELTAGAGLHYTTMEASLKATIDLGGSGGAVEIGGPASVKAPLPVIGMRGMRRIGGDFYLDGQLQYFALSFDGFDGNIINYRIAALWQPKKYIGIGVGFDSFNIDVDLEKDHLTGSMNWTYSGPQVFFNVAF